ncbi:phage portal protein [Desulforhopalus singaporensis]|uniref:Phage portal protein, lambda family n=1 Tax=Desulforhopalus singaporensis TaxID=91360 RepID=A0A1H0UU43_9BACT|nr:phage portal protein [Desulforhopalus singaporensis]SDP69621.1 phage portal protein, lambda family [Desulforhopalus singaporensis]
MSGDKTTITRKIYDRYTSIIGGALNMISPSFAGRWVYGRNMYRAFTAGSTADADRNFNPRLRSGDANVKKAYKLVAARCRDQAENNPLIAGALRRICDNVVRAGIMPKFKFRKADGRLDRKANKEWRHRFLRWAKYCEITGHETYGGTQRLGLLHMWMDGQYFIHRVYDTSRPGIVPLRLELLEFDQLDALVDGQLSNGNVARKGIEYDKSTGRPLFYHFLDHHPGDYLALGRRSTSRRIPAADIIHVWDRRRISQYSGIAWLVAVVMESYRMEDFRHITHDAARTQAAFVAFLKSSMPGFNLGGGLTLGGQSSPATPADTGTKDAPKEIISNIVQKLPPGTDVQMNAPTQPGANYEPFTKDSARYQSAGIGMSFEAYTNNYTDASYASARSGSLEERLSYRGQQQFLEEQPNRGVVAWFIEAAYLAGMNPTPMPGYAKDPDFYHEMAEGQFPGWHWVDPNADAKAAEKLIELTLDTHRNQSASRGLDWDDVIDDAIEEEEQLIKLAELRRKRLGINEGAEE